MPGCPLLLSGSVEATTRPGSPTGCVGVQGSLAARATAPGPRKTLVAWRNDGVARIAERFARAVDDGDLPAGTDPALLARYLMTVLDGIAVQAAGGTTREELQEVADAILRNWPPA